MRHRFRVPLIVAAVVMACLVLWFAAHSARKQEVRRYAMTGMVMAVNIENRSASVHNDDIPGFMRPMEMKYTVNDRGRLSQLKRGDHIRATLVNDGQDWKLENISVIPPSGSH